MSKSVMQMCADEIAERDKKIDDLKKQLAESEELVKGIIESRDMAVDAMCRNRRMYEQQLAEKEKEIERLNNQILISQLQAPKEQILNILGTQCVQYNPNQDKIEFATEQIQKAWDMFSKEYFANEKMETLGTRFFARLDQQIKELRGQE